VILDIILTAEAYDIFSFTCSEFLQKLGRILPHIKGEAKTTAEKLIRMKEKKREVAEMIEGVINNTRQLSCHIFSYKEHVGIDDFLLVNIPRSMDRGMAKLLLEFVRFGVEEAKFKSEREMAYVVPFSQPPEIYVIETKEQIFGRVFPELVRMVLNGYGCVLELRGRAKPEHITWIIYRIRESHGMVESVWSEKDGKPFKVQIKKQFPTEYAYVSSVIKLREVYESTYTRHTMFLCEVNLYPRYHPEESRFIDILSMKAIFSNWSPRISTKDLMDALMTLSQEESAWDGVSLSNYDIFMFWNPWTQVLYEDRKDVDIHAWMREAHDISEECVHFGILDECLQHLLVTQILSYRDIILLVDYDEALYNLGFELLSKLLTMMKYTLPTRATGYVLAVYPDELDDDLLELYGYLYSVAQYTEPYPILEYFIAKKIYERHKPYSVGNGVAYSVLSMLNLVK